MEHKAHVTVPIVPLRGGVVFPGVTTTISIGRRRSLAAAQAAVEQGGELLILVQYNAEVELPKHEDLVPVGILATVRDVLRTPHMGVQMLVELHRRVKAAAALKGQTLKDFLLDALESAADAAESDAKRRG